MDTNSRNKNLIFIIIILLLTNILILGYYFLGHKKHPSGSRDGFETALRKEVGFNDEQMKKFGDLKQADWAVAKNKMEQIRQIKSRLFNLTKEPAVSDSDINILADSISVLQKQVEINAFRHFRATRKICTTEQQPRYDSLMKRIISRQGRSPRSGDKK